MELIKVTPTFSYNPNAPEYRPYLAGDHPYRTTTKFMRDDDGTPVKDMDGFLVPSPRGVDEHRKVIRTPEEFIAARKRIAEKREQEEKAMGKIRRRLNKRQRIGDPNCRESENEDFPLLAVLRRDRNEDAIRVVSEYVRLAAVCAAEPLKGMSYSNREATGLNTEYRTVLRDGVEEVNAAKKAGWKDDQVAGGEIEYIKPRRSKGAYNIPAKRKAAIEYDDNCEARVGRTGSLHVKVTDDVLLDRIDRLPLLMRIRTALGPLVDPFEDAVLGRQTLTKIGADRGFTGVVAATAGKAVVMEAITEVSRFLGQKKYVAANDNYLIEYKKLA